MRVRKITVLASLLAVLAAGSCLAATWEIREADSVVAVITHKGGFASGLAHDHIVAAPLDEASLEFSPDSAEAARFRLRFDTEDLVNDRPDQQESWYPHLERLGILEEPFETLSEKRRKQIRETMLGEDQLDAAQFPEIVAEIVEIRKRPGGTGDGALPYRVTIALTVHGVRAERGFRARYLLEDGKLMVEAVGEFGFREFGIEPYSAMLGAVKNQDRFHVFVHLRAFAPQESTESPSRQRLPEHP